jgi:hypothetical protein
MTGPPQYFLQSAASDLLTGWTLFVDVGFAT